MYIGLPTGYVRFGTVAHAILKSMHEAGGRASFQDFRDAGLGSKSAISVTLGKLRDHGFIFEVDKIHKYDDPSLGSSQMLYSLTPSTTARKYRPASARVRGRRYDARQRTQAFSSVFNIGRRSMGRG